MPVVATKHFLSRGSRDHGADFPVTLEELAGRPSLRPPAVQDAVPGTSAAQAGALRGSARGGAETMWYVEDGCEDLTEGNCSLKRQVLEFRDAVQPLAPVVQDFVGSRAGWPEEALRRTFATSPPTCTAPKRPAVTPSTGVRRGTASAGPPSMPPRSVQRRL
ncbi:hypothetical protein [Streptomyces avermitilis]|uniref:hypothetical protein n=1 Tax=Streptomyces avermitilis TaxID=33903 RepID=UPI0033AEC8D1